jgi:hypothetical protein
MKESQKELDAQNVEYEEVSMQLRDAGDDRYTYTPTYICVYNYVYIQTHLHKTSPETASHL